MYSGQRRQHLYSDSRGGTSITLTGLAQGPLRSSMGSRGHCLQTWSPGLSPPSVTDWETEAQPGWPQRTPPGRGVLAWARENRVTSGFRNFSTIKRISTKLSCLPPGGRWVPRPAGSLPRMSPTFWKYRPTSGALPPHGFLSSRSSGHCSLRVRQTAPWPWGETEEGQERGHLRMRGRRAPEKLLSRATHPATCFICN